MAILFYLGENGRMQVPQWAIEEAQRVMRAVRKGPSVLPGHHEIEVKIAEALVMRQEKVIQLLSEAPQMDGKRPTLWAEMAEWLREKLN